MKYFYFIFLFAFILCDKEEDLEPFQRIDYDGDDPLMFESWVTTMNTFEKEEANMKEIYPLSIYGRQNKGIDFNYIFTAIDKDTGEIVLFDWIINYSSYDIEKAEKKFVQKEKFFSKSISINDKSIVKINKVLLNQSSKEGLNLKYMYNIRVFKNMSSLKDLDVYSTFAKIDNLKYNCVIIKNHGERGFILRKFSQSK